jgi:adenosylhomocysteine nucleosidase
MVLAGGGDAPGAERAAQHLQAAGCTALLSFGLAGGLDPALLPGTLVVPEAVVLPDGDVVPANAGLCAWLGGVSHARAAGWDRLVTDAAGKGTLHAATRAVCVDLESGAVAQAARRHGLPFAVLRAVCDPAGRDLPPAALIALDARGRIGGLRVLASVLGRPGQIGGLLALAREAGRARAALAARVRQAGPLPG